MNFKATYMYATQLLRRLYGEKSSRHLDVFRVPLLYSIVIDGIVFKRVVILSQTLASAIRKARD